LVGRVRNKWCSPSQVYLNGIALNIKSYLKSTFKSKSHILSVFALEITVYFPKAKECCFFFKAIINFCSNNISNHEFHFTRSILVHHYATTFDKFTYYI
jgi:hypothetical protein